MTTLPQSELIAPPHQAVEAPKKPKSKRASDSVADRLRSEIISGRLPVGSRLLPERKLAEVLEVSRVTVRSAIATLQSEQLLEVRRGSGITILDFRKSSSVDIFEWLMVGELQTKEEQYSIFKQVVDVRRALAVPTLFDALGKTTHDFRIQLRLLIEEQRNRIDDPEAYFHGDLEISQAIARQANNIMVELLHNSLKRAMVARLELMLAFIGPPAEHFEGYNLLLSIFDQDSELTKSPEFRQQAQLLLGQFEDLGLARVRELIDNSDIQPQQPESAGLFQKGK